MAAYVKGVKPSVKVYGVEPDDSDCMARSLEAGHPVTVEHPGLFADEVLADGRVDLAEARRILALLDEGFTPSEPLARLMKLLRSAVGDGAVSEAQSQDIARALDETLNLRMRTAEGRRRFMY